MNSASLLSALKSIDSLIKFDKPKCRLKATDVYQELACQQEEDSDIDSAIREKSSKHQCNYCSRPIPAECYQPQKEVDARLCLDCYHKVGLIAGHSSLDFIKENSTKDYGDLDGDSWSDQETLLLLEGMQLYNENWNKIAEHPLDGAPLDNIDVSSTSG
ncbi:SWI/SNF complex subunit SWI3C-like [Salvia divinorum]|uniref:SWI/SNF complex subunit SWI3C-like n=1 Tax=Salvia divinorum TaxID=28513 RepID=A0ABD1FX86_SALDI